MTFRPKTKQVLKCWSETRAVFIEENFVPSPGTPMGCAICLEDLLQWSRALKGLRHPFRKRRLWA